MPPLGLEPWTFLIEQAHSTQNRVQNPKLPSLDMTKRLLIKLLADAAGKIQQNFSAPTVVTLYAAPISALNTKIFAAAE